MYENRRITQRVNCHYDLFNRTVLIELVFRKCIDWFWGPSSLLCSRCCEYSSWDMTLTTHLYSFLLPRMNMSGATTLLPHMPFCYV